MRSVQLSCSALSDFRLPRTAAQQASVFITNFWRLLKLISINLWCHPTISFLLSSSLRTSIFLTIRSFPMSCSSNQVAKIMWLHQTLNINQNKNTGAFFKSTLACFQKLLSWIIFKIHRQICWFTLCCPNFYFYTMEKESSLSCKSKFHKRHTWSKEISIGWK